MRLSGEDCERGTFSHRHNVLHHQVSDAVHDADNIIICNFFQQTEDKSTYKPLANLYPDQAPYSVSNSSLSEYGILGFELGYSMTNPIALVIWEAQFGDFVNGAQVIIDQFITSSESKWGRLSGLVMLLPHGYEGQGPEHSSARLERFLQSCAENNIQVCNVTTPAQYFHLLRRQMKREFKKPLIVMSPKSLLRNRQCVSKVEDFTDKEFWSIIDDETVDCQIAKRIIFCTGKLYYDLSAHREESKINDAAIIRIEQLYPFNTDLLERVLARYSNVESIVWCQEEPKNMGAWSFIAPRLTEILGKLPIYAGRKESASPAVGSIARHRHEQKILIELAFSL